MSRKWRSEKKNYISFESHRRLHMEALHIERINRNIEKIREKNHTKMYITRHDGFYNSQHIQ